MLKEKLDEEKLDKTLTHVSDTIVYLSEGFSRVIEVFFTTHKSERRKAEDI